MEYKCETNRQGQDTGASYAIQVTDDVRFVDARGNDLDGVTITIADQNGNSLATAIVQVNDILAIAKGLEESESVI